MTLANLLTKIQMLALALFENFGAVIVMEYVDVAPPLPPVDQTPVPPQDIFERKISLESESLTLYVGFNGSAYYTRFEADGVPRTYPSWNALWQIWKHFSEVQEAFPNS